MTVAELGKSTQLLLLVMIPTPLGLLVLIKQGRQKTLKARHTRQGLKQSPTPL